MSLTSEPHLTLASRPNDTSFHQFGLFPRLPTEIRVRVWQFAIVAHIVRWVRIDDHATPSSNSFPYLRRRDPTFHVSREARESVFLLGKYISVRLDKTMWYGRNVDYLHLDPAWRKLKKPQLEKNPLNSLPFDFKSIRKIMINPNYTDDRLKPGIALEQITGLREILVVADEKIVALKDKFMLASVYDLQKYYEGVKRQKPEIRIPYIAIGCLGWVGEERMKISHKSEDRWQLVAVFNSQGEMKEHLAKMREEERIFLQSRFSGKKTGFKLKFKPGQSMDGPVAILPSSKSNGEAVSPSEFPKISFET